MAQDNNTDTNLFPESDGEKESSGLQDILSVAAAIKDKPKASDEPKAEDSGVIVFSAGPADLGDSDDDDDDAALFGSFSGGLGGGLVAAAPLDPSPSTSVAEAKPVAAPPAESEGRGPLVLIAGALALALVGGGVFMLMGGKTEAPVAEAQPEQPVAQVGAEPEREQDEEAEAEQPQDGAASELAAADAGEPVEEAAETGGETGEGETGGTAGETSGFDEDDPMGQKEGLLAAGSGTGGKAGGSGKWDPGKDTAGDGGAADAGAGGDDVVDPLALADTKPDPTPDPLPDPNPGGGGGGEDDVDCLLNPDLPKCGKKEAKPKYEDEVLAPKLPEKLGQAELRKGMGSIKLQAKGCGSQNGVPAGTKVKVHVSLEGASGKVTKVEAKGEHAGSALGKCVEGVVMKAKFEPFKKPAMGFDYSLTM